MYKMKYANGLKLLYFIGKCSKCLYYAKKVLCVSFVVLVAVLGLGLLTSGKCKVKALKGMF